MNANAILVGTKCYLISIKFKLIVFKFNSHLGTLHVSMVRREACFSDVEPTQASVETLQHSVVVFYVFTRCLCADVCACDRRFDPAASTRFHGNERRSL